MKIYVKTEETTTSPVSLTELKMCFQLASPAESRMTPDNRENWVELSGP